MTFEINAASSRRPLLAIDGRASCGETGVFRILLALFATQRAPSWRHRPQPLATCSGVAR
jgi:hypothetical protein